MIDAKSPHPNCAYEWMNYITSPSVQAQVAEWFGEAPANIKACAETSDAGHCDTFHANDEAYFKDDLVLDHAAERLPRRAHRRQVRAVLGVDQGVEQPEERLTQSRRSGAPAGPPTAGAPRAS